MIHIKRCPECGSYRMMPHCRNGNCEEFWCIRAQCGYSEGCCSFEQVGPPPWELETLDLLPGTTKRWVKPVKTIGKFTASTTTIGKWVATGWHFAPDGVDWDEDELRSMWDHFAKIEALPSAKR